MKNIVIEKTEVKKFDAYEAIDGTQFFDREECRRYEQSAAGILLERLKKYEINRGSEYDIFDIGSEEWEVRVVVGDCSEIVNQLRMIFYPKHEYINYPSNTPILVHVYYECGEVSNVFINTLDNIVKFATKYTYEVVPSSTESSEHSEEINELNYD